MEPIILASESPRRQNFFHLLEIPFICIPAMIDETPKQGLTPGEVAEDLALRKVLAVANPASNPGIKNMALRSGAGWIFGADTIVVLDGDILGKAANRDEAGQMLGRLAGKRHKVITAMALHNCAENTTDCRSVSCDVEFSPLTKAEIEWYVNTDEWEGAAGAYRIQERGGCLVKLLHGSPSTVAGLPLHEFCTMLQDNGCWQYEASPPIDIIPHSLPC